MWWCVLLGFASAGLPAGTPVETLTAETYFEKVNSTEVSTLVIFHVDWCKICQMALPEFHQAAVTLGMDHVAVSFAHVDCAKDSDFCKSMGVKGYPSIKWHSNGKMRPYKSMRTAKSFVDFTRRMIRDPVLRVESKKKLMDLTKHEVMGCFIYFGDEILPEYLENAQRLQDKHYFFIGDRAKFPGLGKSELLSISFPRQQYFKEMVIAEYDHSANMTAWIQRNRFPGVWNIGDNTFFDFTHSERQSVILAIDPRKGADAKELSHARELHGDQFSFGVLDGVDWADALTDFQIYVEDLPRLLITDVDMSGFWEDSQTLLASNITAAIDDVQRGAAVRQTRDMMNKLFVLQRGVARHMEVQLEFAMQSWMHTGSIVLLWLIVFFLCYMCVRGCCNVMSYLDFEELRYEEQKKDL